MPEEMDKGQELEDALRVMLDGAPPTVQNFILSPERNEVSRTLSSKHNLHVDQAGAFEIGYLYMLLGVNTPDDFVHDLKNAGVAPDVIRNLTNDLNEQVFKRLQHEELKHKQHAPRVPQPIVPIMQVTAPKQEAPIVPQPVPPPLQAPTPSFNLIQPEVPTTAPSPRPAQITSVSMPPMRTMHSDMEAIQHPELHPSQTTPARAFQTASVPYTSAPAVPHTVDSITPPRPQTPPPAQHVILPPVPPISKQPSPPVPGALYSADPYRESFA